MAQPLSPRKKIGTQAYRTLDSRGDDRRDDRFDQLRRRSPRVYALLCFFVPVVVLQFQSLPETMLYAARHVRV